MQNIQNNKKLAKALMVEIAAELVRKYQMELQDDYDGTRIRVVKDSLIIQFFFDFMHVSS